MILSFPLFQFGPALPRGDVPPFTRAQAGPQRVPNDLRVEYHTQRASARLIISYATIISEPGIGRVHWLAVYNDAPEGWLVES